MSCVRGLSFLLEEMVLDDVRHDLTGINGGDERVMLTDCCDRGTRVVVGGVVGDSDGALASKDMLRSSSKSVGRCRLRE